MPYWSQVKVTVSLLSRPRARSWHTARKKTSAISLEMSRKSFYVQVRVHRVGRTRGRGGLLSTFSRREAGETFARWRSCTNSDHHHRGFLSTRTHAMETTLWRRGGLCGRRGASATSCYGTCRWYAMD